MAVAKTGNEPTLFLGGFFSSSRELTYLPTYREALVGGWGSSNLARAKSR
jgi:hypothetical protein